MRLAQPQISALNLTTPKGTAEFKTLLTDQNIDLIVLAVTQSSTTLEQGPLVLDKSPLIDSVIATTDFDFEETLLLWPKFAAKAGEILEITAKQENKPIRIYLLGVGKASQEEYRKAGAALGRKVKGNGARALVTLFSDLTAKSLNQEVRSHVIAFLTAYSLSQYGFEMKSASSSGATSKAVSHALFAPIVAPEISRSEILSNAVWNARDLIHTPSNVKNPAWLAEQAKKMVSATRSSALRVTVKSGRSLAKFGGLRAVGNSVPVPGPRLIEVNYAPTGSKSWPHVVLVGKGITFDTGGISLKRPYDTMVPMKSDMAGAAAILSTICAITQLKPKVRVTALLMCAENMVSGTAQRPSDIITQYSGTTVEVVNTDAEGRLVLADGLAYADLELAPDFLIDVATLTGAASLGLGKQYAAMYSRDARLAQTLSEVGGRTGDLVWHMPLVDDYSPALESDIADLIHVGDKTKFSAGSVTAALFLERFAGKRRWVHLDIAGPARSEKDAGEFVKGGTGFATKLLIEWLATFA